MKTGILPGLLLLLLANCTPSDQVSSAHADSTDVDTASNLVEFDSSELVIDSQNDSLSLDDLYAEKKSAIDSGKDTFLVVTVLMMQYEASKSVVWYFDSAILPVYFYESWSMEGNEGSTERFVEGGSVMCATIEENSMNEKWCAATGGIRAFSEGNSTEKENIKNDDVYGDKQTSAFHSDFQALSSLLQQATLVQENETMLTLEIKNVVNYGDDFTETVEIKIPRKVLEDFGIDK
jgi:hypothetical protein